MKCFKCGKNFDYDKFYGICPKCGCYNKRETSEEQHQQMHNAYDGGYTHGTNEGAGGQGLGMGQPYGGPVQNPGMNQPYAGPGGMQGYQGNVVVREVRPKKKGGTKFLIFSLIAFGLVFIGGTVMGITYQSVQERNIRKQVMEAEPPILEHRAGEAFACKGLMMRVKEARVLAKAGELDLPEGKKLIAIRVEGSGDGSWEDKNRLSTMYICCKDTYYKQIASYNFEPYGKLYSCPALDTYSFMSETYAEGWVAFLMDEDEQEVTLRIDARSGENEIQIDEIHMITLELSKGDADHERT